MEKLINFLIPAAVYIIGGGMIIFLLFFTGCAPFEPIPGLCYTDKTGTYICLKEEPNNWEECKQWTDSEVWSQCMMS